MKRSASTAGLSDVGEGGGAYRASKSAGGGAGGSDVGGSSPPLSPMSPQAENGSPSASDGGMLPEKSSQDQPRSVMKGGKSSTTGKMAASRVSISSPAASDEEGEGKGRGGDKEDDEEEEERLENMELGKYHTVDPDRMQKVLDRFTADQMSRYECYRRSGFQRANMRRLLASVAGCPISIPMTIVMSGISKMFVGELVEVGRIVMTERNDVGPIRPCHIREAYRRLKLEGKVPSRGRAPLFH